MRIRPRAPPLRFWKSRASTTCSRLTLPIFVSTRPIGRPWSWSIGGIPVPEPSPLVGGAAGGRAAPLPAAAGLVGGVLAPISGALGVVVFGRFAPEPGMPGLAPLVPGPPVGRRFGSLGLDGLGGVARD